MEEFKNDIKDIKNKFNNLNVNNEKSITDEKGLYIGEFKNGY